MKKFLFLLSASFAVTQAFTQYYTGDWDTYVLQVEGKPVSVMVDLNFGNSSLAKEKRNVIIVRMKLKQIQPDGMPEKVELKLLDSIENNLVNDLGLSLGAQYTGRFTQRGFRDFYFYSNDTLNSKMQVSGVLQHFPSYSWTTLVKSDPDLSNYYHVLYPTPEESERIKNRRMVETLQEKGDLLTAPRKVNHWIYFRTEIGRKSFVHIIQDNGYVVERADKEVGIKDYPYSLQISRVDKVDFDSINKVSIFLWKLSLQYFGKYDGWETFVVR